MRQPLPVPDVTAEGLEILFVGINPGVKSGETGYHFARPGNRFWKAIHLAGLTPNVLTPDRSRDLLRYGIGITNICPRVTAKASELTDDELRAGAQALAAKVRHLKPKKVAFLGLSAYRVAFGQPNAVVGRQDESVGGCETWAMPNPSGLNAHYQLAGLAQVYSALK